MAGTRRTVREIKRQIVEGTRSFDVRRLACTIAKGVPSKDRTGEIEAIWEWISSVPFREDPVNLELLITPERQIEEIEKDYGLGVDCDDYVMLGGALMRSIGIPVRVVLMGEDAPDVYSHIYLEAFDRDRGEWTPFDPAVPGKPLGWSYPDPASKWVETFNTSDEFAGPWPRDGVVSLSGISSRADRRVRAVLQGFGQLESGSAFELGPGIETGEILPERDEPDAVGREEPPTLEIEGDGTLEVEPGFGIDIDEPGGSGFSVDMDDPTDEDDEEGFDLCMEPGSGEPWCENITTDEDEPLDWDIDIDEDPLDDSIDIGTEDDDGGIFLDFDEDDAEDYGYDLDWSQRVGEDEPAGETWIDIDRDLPVLPDDLLADLIAELQPREIGERDVVSTFSSMIIMSLVVFDREIRSGDEVRIRAAYQALGELTASPNLAGLIKFISNIGIGKFKPVKWAMKQVAKVFRTIEKVLGPKLGGFITGLLKIAITNLAQTYGGPFGRLLAEILIYEIDGGIDWLELKFDQITLIGSHIIKGISEDDSDLDIDQSKLDALQRDIDDAKEIFEDFIEDFKKGMKQQISILRESYEDAREEMEQAYNEGRKTAGKAFEEMQDLRAGAEEQLADWREIAEQELAGIKDRFGRLLEARGWLEQQTEEILRQADVAISLEVFDDFQRTQDLMTDLQRRVDLGVLDPRAAFSELEAFEKNVISKTNERIATIEKQAKEAIAESERIQNEVAKKIEEMRKTLSDKLNTAFKETGEVATDAMVGYVELVGLAGLTGLAEILLETEGVILFERLRERGIDIARVRAAAVQFELVAIMDIEISVVTAVFGEESLVAATRFELLPPDEQEQLNELAELLKRDGILDKNGKRKGTRVRESSAEEFSRRRRGKIGDGLDLTMDQMIKGAQPDYPPPLGEEPEYILAAGDTGLIKAGGDFREPGFFERNKTLLAVGGVAAAAAGAVALARRMQ